jgi:hypothetical protein
MLYFYQKQYTMFKNCLLSFSLLAATASFAQITIHQSDMPNAGDSIHVSVTNTTGGPDPSLTGVSYSWDFSTLTPNSQRSENFDSPLTFPSPYNLIFNPFNTTYGKNNYQNTGSPAPGFSIDAAYDFFKESSANLRQIGAAYTINGTPIPFMYSLYDTLYRFPMNYLNIDSCDYKYGLNIPTFGYYGQKGHRVNEVDGWGAIITPYGSFAALRVKSSIATIDTVYSDAFGFGTNIPRPLKHEYKWMATGKKIPVLEVDAVVTGGTDNVTNVVYIDSLRAGVPQTGIAENAFSTHLSVYPNPCIDKAFVQYELSASARIKISVSNTLGQILAVIADGNMATGTQLAVIDVKGLNLNPGIYFVTLESGKNKEVKKIVVGR